MILRNVTREDVILAETILGALAEWHDWDETSAEVRPDNAWDLVECRVQKSFSPLACALLTFGWQYVAAVESICKSIIESKD